MTNGNGNGNRSGLSPNDIRLVVFALVAIVGAVLMLDFIGSAFITDFTRTDSTIFGVIIGGVTSIIIGRAIWPRNGGGGPGL